MLPSRVNLSDEQERSEAAEYEINSFMDPLSVEYNNTIRFLQEEIQKHKDEHQNLKSQCMRLIEENKRMYEKLKETLEQRIYESPVERGTIENLEHQLQTVTEAKNSVLEMWQIALQEIEHLEKLLEEKRNDTEFQAVEGRIAQVKAEYAEAINVLSEELSCTKIELRNVRNELQSRNDQLNEYKRTVENFADQLKSKEKYVDDTSLQKKEMAERKIKLESSLAEAQKNLSKSNEEISALRKNIQELLSLNADIKKQNAELKLRESASLKEAREGLLTAEKAVLEKEEAVYKEQQALKEIQQLKVSLNQVTEQAKEKNKSEVKLFKKQYDEKIQQLMEEIQALELGIGEKQNAFERVIREKRAAESELEALYKENYDGIPNSNPVFEDMSKRLTQAERLRDAAQLHAQTLENAIKDLNLSKEQEIHYLQTECKTLKQRLQKYQADFIEISSDRVQLTNQVEQLKKRCSFTEKALAAAQNKHKTEMNHMEQKLQEIQTSCQQQLRTTEELHKKAISELRFLLDAQHKISNKWREEVNEITLKFETKMKEMYDDIMQLQLQNEELSQALQINQVNFVSSLETS